MDLTKATSITINTSSDELVLVNYKEVIAYFNLPFYKKWITKKPVKELKKIN